ncbi:MAG TPA: acyl-CoA carboxylase subunit epsilon [Streptosporangiaceae bacterium]|nr:acyl-CoA carboxylase subunit epsilon [Streptosporangiaceae bacterium]
MNLQIVRGDATPEEIAALVAVLTARARRAAVARGSPGEQAAGSSWRGGAAAVRAGVGGSARPRATTWADRSRGLRVPIAPGPGAWRASARPG